MSKTFPGGGGFEHLKGPTLLAATTNGLLAIVLAPGTSRLIESRADFTAFMFAMAWLAVGMAFATYLSLLLFFLQFYRWLTGASEAITFRRIALVAAIAIFLNTILDTYFRLRLRWDFVEVLKWLFSVGVVPVLTLSLFLGLVALRSNPTIALIRGISAVLTATMGLQAILRTTFLVEKLIKIDFRLEWSWGGWWSFLLQPSILVFSSAALAIFFFGIWESDTRAIRGVH